MDIDEAAAIIARELRDILQNNVTVRALDSHGVNLTPEDVIANVHLYDRVRSIVRALTPLYGPKLVAPESAGDFWWNGAAENEVQTDDPAEVMAREQRASKVVRIVYMNHRGVLREYDILPAMVYHGSNEWHPEAQWLMTAYTRKGLRSFALQDIQTWDGQRAPKVMTTDELRRAAFEEGFNVIPPGTKTDGTKTGRFSMAAPNPSNLPTKGEDLGPVETFAEGDVVRCIHADQTIPLRVTVVTSAGTVWVAMMSDPAAQRSYLPEDLVKMGPVILGWDGSRPWEDYQKAEFVTDKAGKVMKDRFADVVGPVVPKSGIVPPPETPEQVAARESFTAGALPPVSNHPKRRNTLVHMAADGWPPTLEANPPHAEDYRGYTIYPTISWVDGANPDNRLGRISEWNATPAADPKGKETLIQTVPVGHGLTASWSLHDLLFRVDDAIDHVVQGRHTEVITPADVGELKDLL